MKRKFLLTLLAIVACVVPNFAKSVQIGGLYYDLNSLYKRATVTYKSYTYSNNTDNYNSGWNITTATIPSSVTYNGETYTVTSIGEYAFSGCSSLTSVTIPESVTSIGTYAFSGCSSLTSVHISDIAAWCSISFGMHYANPLYYAHNLYLNGELVTDLVIPEGVESIRYYAFYNCSNLTSVTIPNSVTNIGKYAFSHCSSLTSVTIPNSVTNIGDYVFNYCSSLTSITIPNSIESIGEYAFSNCSSLTSITIPNSVTSIGSYAFVRCSSLTSVTIPNSVERIGWAAFSDCSSLTSVTIPNSVTSIRTYAFERCSSLTSVTIGNSVTTIDEDAFYACKSLTSVHISDIAAWYKISFGSLYANPLYYAHNLYLNDELVTDLVIPEGIESIGKYAFYNCSNLTSVTIPNSVESIGYYAFSGCSSLTSVHISDIAAWCKISFADAGANPLALNLYLNGELVTDLVIPNSVTSIGNYAFYDCSSLTSVTIPISVTNIGEDAFYGCSGLTSVTIPESVTNIGNYAFSGCSSLTKVTLHSNSIVSETYTEYPTISEIFGSQVEEYVLGEGVKSIGNYAFYNCSSLTSVSIANSVRSIGEYAFSNTNISEINISDNIESVGKGAFTNCPLTKVVWDVPKQDDYDIIGDKDRITVTLKTNNLAWSKVYLYAWDSGNRAILGNWPGTELEKDNDGNYSYTFNSIYHYDNPVNIIWTDGSEQTEDIKSVAVSTVYELYTKSGSKYTCTESFAKLSPFAYCTGITDFTFGKSVQRVPAHICEGLSKLQNLSIGESTTEIGNSAFSDCSNIKTISLPNSIQVIGNSAFRNCSALTSLTLGDNISTYGDYSFTNCTKLTSIRNYKARPAKLGEEVFKDVDYFNCTLYVLASSLDMYKSVGSDWKDFYFIEPIGATSTTTDDVEIDAHLNTADVVWPQVSGAASYEFVVKDKDGSTICAFYFNAQGQLTQVAFHAPARNRAPEQTYEQVAGFQFTITGLQGASKYTYSLTAKDDANNELKHYSGTFSTEGYVGTYYIVTFRDGDWSLIDTQTIEEYSYATVPAAPYREGYYFIGWGNFFDGKIYSAEEIELIAVTADTLYIAQYEEISDGIEDVASSDSNRSTTRKVIIDGVIYILKDGKTYNVLGAEVK